MIGAGRSDVLSFPLSAGGGLRDLDTARQYDGVVVAVGHEFRKLAYCRVHAPWVAENRLGETTGLTELKLDSSRQFFDRIRQSGLKEFDHRFAQIVIIAASGPHWRAGAGACARCS
jgi:hypothetical protein